MDINYKTYMNSLVSVIVSSLDTKLENIIDNEPFNWLGLVLNSLISIFLLVFLFLIIKLKRKINKINNNMENSIPQDNSERFYPMNQEMSIESEQQPKTSRFSQYRTPKSVISEDSVSSDDSQSTNLQTKNNFFNAIVQPTSSQKHKFMMEMTAPYNVYSQ